MSQDNAAHAPLSGTDRKWLRGKAHHLDPLVQIGKAGLSEGVLVGTIGNIAIFYRAHPDPEKRKFQLPGRAGQGG